jgi:hypothetical protein
MYFSVEKDSTVQRRGEKERRGKGVEETVISKTVPFSPFPLFLPRWISTVIPGTMESNGRTRE